MCSNESLPKSLWPFSLGSKQGWNAARLLKMQVLITLLFAALVLSSSSGCSRTILVSESSPIRIGQVRGTVYASVNGEWRLSENEVAIPEGWYCVPPSFMDAIGNGG
jgi:hypothetical protein